MNDDLTSDIPASAPSGGPDVFDDGFADGLASLDSYFASNTGSVEAVRPDAPAPRFESAGFSLRESLSRAAAARMFCEVCHNEIDAGTPDVVTAVQLIGDPGQQFEGLPRNFHSGCWERHSGDYRLT